jgi:hypothetical protein
MPEYYDNTLFLQKQGEKNAVELFAVFEKIPGLFRMFL